MCAIVGKPLISAYMHEKNLGQLPVLISLAMTTGAILCRWYVVPPWTCHRAEHPSSSSSPHLGQVSLSVSVSVSVSASKYRYRYRYRFLVSVTALIIIIPNNPVIPVVNTSPKKQQVLRPTTPICMQPL